MEIQLEGQCLCGAVRIAFTPLRAGIEACHCGQCQRWTGGPFLSLRGVPRGDIRIAGEDHIASYRSSEWAERAHCSRCGSALWFAFLPADRIAFAAGLFALPSDWMIEEEIFIDDRAPHVPLATGSTKKTGAAIIAEAASAGYALG